MHGRRLRSLTVLALLLLACGGATAAAAPVRTTVSRGLYDRRYCEFLVVHGTPPALTADVWNTYGLNDCPAPAWAAADPAALAATLGALAVVRNGPRHWLMDRAEVRLAPGFGDVRAFGPGLRMRHIATVEVPVGPDGRPGAAPYHPTTVHRRTVFVFGRRHLVHELVAPDGTTYVMQTYAQIADPALRLGDLGRLGARLHRPAGWRYRTRRLRHDLVVRASGRAIVVQDELGDTYQRA